MERMFDRNTIIGLVLSAVLFMVFIYYTSTNQRKQLAEDQKAAQERQMDSIRNYAQKAASMPKPAPTPATPVATQGPDSGIVHTPAVDKYGPFSAAAAGKEQLTTIENDVIKLVISNKGGKVHSIELKKYKKFDKTPLLLALDRDFRFTYQFPLNDNRVISTEELYFTPPAKGFTVSGTGSNSVSFILPAGNGQYIEQKYTLHGNSYLVGYQTRFVNLSSIMPISANSINLKWAQTCRQQEKNITQERRYSGLYYQFKNGDVEHLGLTKNEDKQLTTSNWLCFKQQFFNITLLNKTGFTGNVKSYFDVKELDYNKQYSAELFFPIQNGNGTIDCDIYMGPNDYTALKKLDNGMEQIIPLASDIAVLKYIGLVNKFVIIPVFNLLKQVTTNYGIIIFILALLVRIVLTPLTYNSYKYSAIMQLLKPELDELKLKYKDDQQKLGTEQMKLYQKVGVNPLSGCIPVLLQMPILLAMYNFFPASIELRQSAFLWANDLSSYDAILTFPVLFGSFDHISLFTVLMTVTSILNAFITPQMSSQDNPAMKYMPYIFPFMLFFVFNSFPAALTYYYLLFNVMSMAQQYIIKKFFIDEKKLHQELKDRKNKEPKKSGWMARLENMQKEQQQKASGKPAKK
jgi:YidC/Oxa1 family membrane protein insertase